MNQADIWQLLSRLPQPEQPFITVINDLGRVELSGRTLINGICKAANAFRDILDTEPGHSASIDLGWTWQQSVWQGAALVAGLKLAADNHYDIRITPEIISTHPLGLPSGGVQDITAEVLGQPDVWLYPEYFGEQTALISEALHWTEQVGISKNDRVGIDTSRAPVQSLFFAPLLAPLVTQGSVVILDGHSSESAHVCAQEKVTLLLTP